MDIGIAEFIKEVLSNDTYAEFFSIEHKVGIILIQSGIVGECNDTYYFEFLICYLYAVALFQIVAFHVKSVKGYFFIIIRQPAFKDTHLVYVLPVGEQAYAAVSDAFLH